MMQGGFKQRGNGFYFRFGPGGVSMKDAGGGSVEMEIQATRMNIKS